MKTKKMLSILVFGLLMFQAQIGIAEPLGTAFTYQGRLLYENEPANGLYDFGFTLYDDPYNGNRIGPRNDPCVVEVIDGYFSAELDFGDFFSIYGATTVYIEVEVGPTPPDPCDPDDEGCKGGRCERLRPRRKLTGAPYAGFAQVAQMAYSVDPSIFDPWDGDLRVTGTCQSGRCRTDDLDVQGNAAVAGVCRVGTLETLGALSVGDLFSTLRLRVTDRAEMMGPVNAATLRVEQDCDVERDLRVAGTAQITGPLTLGGPLTTGNIIADDAQLKRAVVEGILSSGDIVVARGVNVMGIWTAQRGTVWEYLEVVGKDALDRSIWADGHIVTLSDFRGYSATLAGNLTVSGQADFAGPLRTRGDVVLEDVVNIKGSLEIPGGAGAGKVLTCGPTGGATWQTPPTGIAGVEAGTGLTGGGAAGIVRLELAAVYADGSVYDGRFVAKAGDTMTGPLTVTGACRGDELEAVGTCRAGDLDVRRNAAVTGVCSAGRLETAGPLSADSGLVARNLDVGGALRVTGASSVGPLEVLGPTTLRGSLDVEGEIISDGLLTAGSMIVYEVARMYDLTVDGQVKITGGYPEAGKVFTAIDDDGAGGWLPLPTGGDIMAVTAGPGLIGGGTSGDVALDVAFSGTGLANLVARSDHDHDAAYAASAHAHDDRYSTEAELSESGLASVHWSNLTNMPPDIADGDQVGGVGDITAVAVGTGLTGGGIAGDVAVALGASYVDGSAYDGLFLRTTGGTVAGPLSVEGPVDVLNASVTITDPLGNVTASGGSLRIESFIQAGLYPVEFYSHGGEGGGVKISKEPGPSTLPVMSVSGFEDTIVEVKKTVDDGKSCVKIFTGPSGPPTDSVLDVSSGSGGMIASFLRPLAGPKAGVKISSPPGSKALEVEGDFSASGTVEISKGPVGPITQSSVLNVSGGLVDMVTAAFYGSTSGTLPVVKVNALNPGEKAIATIGSVDINGNLTVTGAKAAIIETSEGPKEIFCVEGPEVEIYSSGSARLSGGAASVAFDRLFTEAVSTQIEVRVTVTPVGGWSALYVESNSVNGFDVRSAGGDENVEFHWMACGRRKGYETRPQ